MKRRYFGTDGIRGRVGQAPITPEFVMKLGWAAGQALADSDRKCTILVGKDTRVSGYLFESALQAGLIASGVEVGLLGPMPTPGVAYLTRTLSAQAGIVISASHNPHYDNGIKFFSGDGFKLPDQKESEIEALMSRPITTKESADLGRAFRIVDAAGRYIEFCKSSVPRGFSLRGFKVVVDCANGATYHIAPRVFKELGADVVAISAEPDGFNINHQCGSTKPEVLQKRVLDEQADFGVALDGDGDRVLMVDHQGEVVNGDELLFVIARHLNSQQRCNGVVGTQMSNLGLEKACEQHGIEFVRTRVGDRYVMEGMKEHHFNLGGESSGHVICAELTTTGDGIISALQAIAAVVDDGRTLSAIKRDMMKYPQVLINVSVDNKNALDDHPEIEDAKQAIEAELANSGRVLLRPSGTESVVRVMLEGENIVQINTLAQKLAADVKRILSA